MSGMKVPVSAIVCVSLTAIDPVMRPVSVIVSKAVSVTVIVMLSTDSSILIVKV